MSTTNPLEALLVSRLLENDEYIDAEIVDPNEVEPEKHYNPNKNGLTPEQQAAVTRANLAINALLDRGVFEYWLENRLAPMFSREMSEAVYQAKLKK